MLMRSFWPGMSVATGRSTNRVHWVRDWSFDEDRHQLRSLASPAQVLATLRNLSMSLIRLAGSNQILATMRWIARLPQRSAQLIGAMPA